MVAYLPNILVLPSSSVHFSMTGTLSLNVVLFASVGLPDSNIVLPSGRSASVTSSILSRTATRTVVGRSFIISTIPQTSITVNLRALFSLIYYKIKIVTIFSVCRMVCATYFLPRVHIYLWEKSVSIGEFGVNFRGVNSVNFWNI